MTIGIPRRALGLLGFLVLACREPAAPPAPAPQPVATAVATPVAATSPATAGTEPAPEPAPPAASGATTAPPTSPGAAAPTALPVSNAQAIEPGNGLVALQNGAEAVVDAGARFRIEVGLPIRDARLVLLDARDAHVAASEVREVGTSTLLELTPSPALRPGSKYLLRVEGADGGALRDADGRTYVPLAVPIQVAGTPPPEAPAKPARAKTTHAKRSRHKRHR